ncbi:glycosyl hydrolase [Microbacterium yannicii]|uniref:glycosyl hydrolase n=1 Tax=Microbacterium yannicii TaxID=671622 RepID=UPI0002EBA6B5|nr:glycosyl hydrolase [Microbacterium yannicii]
MTLEDFRREIADPAIEFRPELRWWLAEGLHTDETLRREVGDAHRLGFGGMEFLAMDEGAIDHARYGWGSEEWVHDSQVVVEETTARGMSVSFTSGTNWSNANLPTITPDDPAAAQELDVISETPEPGQSRSGAVPRIDLSAPPAERSLPGHRGVVRDQHFVAAVAARVVDSEAGVLDASSLTDVTASVLDGALEWTAPADGTWQLFYYWRHGTGQTAEPSSSVNYTVTYLDRDGVDAVIAYWDDVVLTPALRERIAENPRAHMYMDSLELDTYGAGGLFWGRTVVDEFRARRGYDVVPWLPFLTRDVPFMAVSTVYHYEPSAEADRVAVAKVRHDLVRTFTDLYIENMLRPFAAFLHGVGLTLRAEISYGLPFELTRPGPEVDGIETESLEFGSQIDAYRLMGGPAHLFGKQYSSETGATTRNHMLDHRFYDQIIATQLAAGITKTVLHGWASPAGAEGVTHWPGHEGMWPMFSERFDTRQPGSEFYPQWNAAVGRLQYALRRGRPRIDVGILRTDHFTDNLIGVTLRGRDGERIPDEVAYGTMWMRDRENHWWQDLGMQDAGITYEFFDGSLLLRDDVSFDGDAVQPDGPGYRALIVYQSTLDADVATHLLAWARRGLRVVVVHGARELESLRAERHRVHEAAASSTPGLDGRDAELAETMAVLTSLDTVVVTGPAGVVEALDRLGAPGRARFVESNASLLTHLREDGDLTVLYAYHFLYETAEPTTVRLRLDGRGTVHRLDAWSGRMRPHRGTRVLDDATIVELTLSPGETAIVVLDRSGASPADTAPVSRIPVATLDAWELTVESWDAGESELISEDRGHGYVTREVRPMTAVTRVEAGAVALRPWSQLDAVGPDVSGIGEYTATLDVADIDADARYILELGSTGGGLGSVRVGDGPERGFDTARPAVDVTDDLRAGSNTVRVRVSTSLNNRLRARGYYERIPDVAMRSAGEDHTQLPVVREYGLLGPVRLMREN